MAAALIPLLPTLIPAIASAVVALTPIAVEAAQFVEGLLGGGTGDLKQQVAFGIVKPVATQMSTAGKIQGIPDDATIATILETVVQRLKLEGQLPTATPAPGAKPAGTKVTFTGTMTTE